MPLPTFADKTDGVDIVYAADVNNLQDETAPTAAGSATVRYSTAFTSTANITLGDTSMPVQSVAFDASRDVTLPAVSTANHPFYIYNRAGSTSGFVATVKNAAAAVVAYVRPQSAGVFFPDSTTNWFGITAPSFKIGLTTFGTSSTSTSSTITGVGFPATAIIIFAGVDDTSEISIGVSNSTLNYCLYDVYTYIAGHWGVYTTGCIQLLQSAAVSLIGTITAISDDGFTIGWTKNGAKTGTATIFWLAMK